MVIFRSYVSLPEGTNKIYHLHIKILCFSKYMMGYHQQHDDHDVRASPKVDTHGYQVFLVDDGWPVDLGYREFSAKARWQK